MRNSDHHSRKLFTNVILSEDGPAAPARPVFRCGLVLSEAQGCASESKAPSASYRGRSLGIFFTLFALLTTLPIYAQTANRFAEIHVRLNAAADAALAQSSTPAILSEARSEVGRAESRDLHWSPSAASARLAALRPAIDPILREHGLPAELAAVVLVESGGQLTALSAKGARGPWQIMPDTARRYGLVVNSTRDDRLDLRKSTQAAARYLSDLYAQFRAWPLALAAYNAGELAVQRAVQRAGTRDFVALSRALPLETRAYVPAVLSAASGVGFSASPPAASGRVVYASME